jgi:hypothetical protein
VTDHDMVVQLDLKSIGSCLQFACHLDVVSGRLDVTRRMISTRLVKAALASSVDHEKRDR